MKIAILGAGNLGLSIAKGLIVNNAITTLYLTKRNTENIENWSEYDNVNITSDNKEAVIKSDIIIITVQPGHAQNILLEIADVLSENHVIISTVTGFKINIIE